MLFRSVSEREDGQADGKGKEQKMADVEVGTAGVDDEHKDVILVDWDGLDDPDCPFNVSVQKVARWKATHKTT